MCVYTYIRTNLNYYRDILNIKSANKQRLVKSRHETHQRELGVEVEAADSGAPHINQRTNQHIDLSGR